MTHILMIAAENGALPGGKVGGIGDVVRDVPRALVERDCRVTVLTPAYGSFTQLPGAKKIKSLKIIFGSEIQAFDIYELSSSYDNLRHLVIDHPLFSACGAGKIYCNNLPDRPFAIDASKFALFCLAAAESIVKNAIGKIDVLHLHDWHAALLLVLRNYDPNYKKLKKIRCVYSIHNLAIQGIRPFSGDESSMQAWFPWLSFERKKLADPRWSDCINPMAIAIRMADSVHTVSPNYAEEILQPSDVEERGFYGGEGLEADLRTAKAEGRLFGILNGCEYPRKKKPAVNSWKAFSDLMRQQLLVLASANSELSSALFIAQSRLNQLGAKRPQMLLSSIGRITRQKTGLMIQPTSSGQPALEKVLQSLGDSGLLIMIGSGNVDDEAFLTQCAARFDNFIFLRGYSEELAEALYQLGDLFFMPSSFEPCGISQMLAMRAGQPCLVHDVGGLHDTVQDNKTGFSFAGDNPIEQADNLVATVQRAQKLFRSSPDKWKQISKAAAAQRFKWADSIDAYLNLLYKIS